MSDKNSNLLIIVVLITIFVIIILLGIAWWVGIDRDELNSNTNSIANSNAGTDLNCMGWEPGFCDAVINSGYYFNDKTGKCDYFSGGSGCSDPPFKTLDQCKSICGLNDRDTTDCSEINDYKICNYRNDCLVDDLCDCTTEYNRKKKCGQEARMECLCVQGGFEKCIELEC